MSDLGEVVLEKPRYDGESIVNLTASIISASGGAPSYPPLQGLDLADLERARHLMLIVIDGMGFEFLCSTPSVSTLRKHLRRSITSVFPPTTASAVTAFLTGLAPQQHGLTGWFMYMRELGSVVSVLPFATRCGRMSLSAAGLEPRSLFGHTSIFDLLARPGISVSPRDIAHSPFNEAHSGRATVLPYAGIEGLIDCLERSVRDARQPSFIYAYWPELDHMAHTHGIADVRLQRHLEEIDAALERLLDRLRGQDVIVIVTADHGFVDVKPGGTIWLSEHAELKDSLIVPLCGEPRAAYCYTSPARRVDFARYVASELSHCAVCVPSQELIDGGYYGRGAPHPELRNRIGDFTLVMRDGYALLDELPGERRFAPIGVHGGGSSAELRVPLIVAAV